MTDKKYDFEYLEEGDTFEGGPLEQSAFISELQAAGGEFELKGNKVLIKKLAKKESKAKAPASPKKAADAPKKAEAKEEAPKEAPKAEAKEDDKKEAPKAEVKDTSDDKTKE